MELVKNVFFNTDKLVENAKVKISYVGKLFQENSSEVYLHYGFGSNWDNVNEIKMEKTELGFQAEIELLSSDTLNFCFRNSNNEWDNNENANYNMIASKHYKNTEVSYSSDSIVKEEVTEDEKEK